MNRSAVGTEPRGALVQAQVTHLNFAQSSPSSVLQHSRFIVLPTINHFVQITIFSIMHTNGTR